MAKANIHPDYHTITVVLSNGTRYPIRSTYGKEGDVLQLDVDPTTHSAWVGGVQLRKTGRLERFNDRFSGIKSVTSMPGESASEKTDAKK
jgi:large subunit ribosomal protein L31